MLTDEVKEDLPTNSHRLRWAQRAQPGSLRSRRKRRDVGHWVAPSAQNVFRMNVRAQQEG